MRAEAGRESVTNATATAGIAARAAAGTTHLTTPIPSTIVTSTVATTLEKAATTTATKSATIRAARAIGTRPIRAARIATAGVAHAAFGLTGSTAGRIAAAHHFFSSTASCGQREQGHHNKAMFHQKSPLKARPFVVLE